MKPLHWLWYTLPLVHLPGVEPLMRGRIPPLGEEVQAARPLAVAAHPDDLEYFCGGLLARLSQSGARVGVLLTTRGEAGGDPMVRRAEQEEAARLLGYHDLYLLDFPDRGVNERDPRLHRELERAIAHHQADLLLTFDPVHPYPIYRHSDHMATARAVLPLWQGRTILFHTHRPNLAVDITSVFSLKVSAFSAHRSQLPRRGTARLAGWHLGARNRAGGGRLLELYRTFET